MTLRSIIVRAAWDPEAGVFVATSDDVPGLITEARTLPDLNDKLAIMIPELIELNSPSTVDSNVEGERRDLEVPLYIMAEQVSRVRITG
jgi:hypothetical protein